MWGSVRTGVPKYVHACHPIRTEVLHTVLGTNHVSASGTSNTFPLLVVWSFHRPPPPPPTPPSLPAPPPLFISAPAFRSVIGGAFVQWNLPSASQCCSHSRALFVCSVGPGWLTRRDQGAETIVCRLVENCEVTAGSVILLAPFSPFGPAAKPMRGANRGTTATTHHVRPKQEQGGDHRCQGEYRAVPRTGSGHPKTQPSRLGNQCLAIMA